MKTFAYLLSWLLLLSAAAQARTIHFVGAFDTGNTISGRQMKMGKEKVVAAFQRLTDSDLQRRGDFSFRQHLITGSQFNRATILGTIDRLNVGSDDTVILFVNCHGFRLRGDSDRFGRLITEGTVGGSELGLKVRTLHERAKRKQARLTLTFVEACNEVMSVEADEEPEIWSSDSSMITRFLLQPEGDLLMAASSPDQYAFCPYELGGVFADRYASFMDYVVNGSNTLLTLPPNRYPSDWQGAVRTLAAETKHQAGTVFKLKQRNGQAGQDPIYELNVSN